MAVIGVVQIKGGAGRSTIAVNLAAELGKKTLTALIDCDLPQGTAASWGAVRKLDYPTVETANTQHELINQVQRLATDHAHIILDAPPRVAEITRTILMLTDLLLIPLGASAAEIWATSDLIDTLTEDGAERRDLETRIIWNRYRRFTRSAKTLRRAVGRELPIKALRTTLGYRVSYSDALEAGLAVTEWSDRKARKEVEALAREVLSVLRKVGK